MLVIEHVDLSTKRRTTIGSCENNLELAHAIIRQFLRQFLQLEYDDRLPRFVEYGDLNNGGISNQGSWEQYTRLSVDGRPFTTGQAEQFFQLGRGR